ncbi:hypothetical protein EYF80_042845 [Liparis tanakae]|uniref:Uncharacterized protein n=1 Tax=Liparis tanakae TaxID=230148 RepID=A0A4Z2G295_9TELE|nr:hypothetical protein EYF80_042845 [Liparis tanakae]
MNHNSQQSDDFLSFKLKAPDDTPLTHLLQSGEAAVQLHGAGESLNAFVVQQVLQGVVVVQRLGQVPGALHPDGVLPQADGGRQKRRKPKCFPDRYESVVNAMKGRTDLVPHRCKLYRGIRLPTERVHTCGVSQTVKDQEGAQRASRTRCLRGRDLSEGLGNPGGSAHSDRIVPDTSLRLQCSTSARARAPSSSMSLFWKLRIVTPQTDSHHRPQTASDHRRRRTTDGVGPQTALHGRRHTDGVTRTSVG